MTSMSHLFFVWLNLTFYYAFGIINGNLKRGDFG